MRWTAHGAAGPAAVRLGRHGTHHLVTLRPAGSTSKGAQSHRFNHMI